MAGHGFCFQLHAEIRENIDFPQRRSVVSYRWSRLLTYYLSLEDRDRIGRRIYKSVRVRKLYLCIGEATNAGSRWRQVPLPTPAGIYASLM